MCAFPRTLLLLSVGLLLLPLRVVTDTAADVVDIFRRWKQYALEFEADFRRQKVPCSKLGPYKLHRSTTGCGKSHNLNGEFPCRLKFLALRDKQPRTLMSHLPPPWLTGQPKQARIPQRNSGRTGRARLEVPTQSCGEPCQSAGAAVASLLPKPPAQPRQTVQLDPQ